MILHLTCDCALALPQVVSPDECGQQQEGDQFCPDQIRPKQRDPDLFGADHDADGALTSRPRQDVQQLPRQNERQNGRADPHARVEPLALLRHRFGTKIEHHHDKYKQHHDGPGVDDDF